MAFDENNPKYHMKPEEQQITSSKTIDEVRNGFKPVATVRVSFGGYGMDLSTHIAYALSEGKHDLYVKPTPVVAMDILREAILKDDQLAIGMALGLAGLAKERLALQEKK
jgi:hypothetical protein